MFTLNIRTDNDAFGSLEDRRDAQRDAEIARILRDTADRLERGDIVPGSSATLHDINGNDVGRAKVTL